MTTPPMFDLPTPTPVVKSLSLRKANHEGKATWTRCRPKTRVPCDECVIVLHENHGVGAFPRSVRWRRTSDGTALRLCDEHAREWKAEE